jgi:hypothetical protein
MLDLLPFVNLLISFPLVIPFNLSVDYININTITFYLTYYLLFQIPVEIHCQNSRLEVCILPLTKIATIQSIISLVPYKIFKIHVIDLQ